MNLYEIVRLSDEEFEKWLLDQQDQDSIFDTIADSKPEESMKEMLERIRDMPLPENRLLFNENNVRDIRTYYQYHGKMPI